MRSSAAISMALLVAGCTTTVVQEPPARPFSPPPVVHPSAPGNSYTVVKGDTLYSIAFRNGMDFRQLAQMNGIAAPYTIWPGQVLALSGHAPRNPPPVIAKAPPPSIPPPPPSPPSGGFQSVTPGAVVTTPVPPPAHPATVAPAVSAAPPPAVPPTPPPAATPVIAASGGSRAAGGVKWRWPASGSVVGRFQSSAAIPGIDIAGKEGDPVVAAADGVVVYSGNGLVGYGELVIIKHNDSLLSAYGHNRKRLVTEGQQVKAGQQIAEMGSSGSSRDELEFQIRKDGSPVDPLDYLPSR
ncbi:LysM peptidoglycan-binding domain-containing protein [Dyella dinghuensis]|uniref:LysM peptidoglycan-binding domain-containing protein n=1 Tax=Dyella dinghuensis TaxID=1920169 RepID=A0A432LX75_9GAMM|nr:peptidoglycan DD-metalloendopeptidase family protein [Dyella dinghuensis]RUL66716.1 LysM peptidoglycan-binding domain-containing protein [Dyella dinghuensis]